MSLNFFLNFLFVHFHMYVDELIHFNIDSYFTHVLILCKTCFQTNSSRPSGFNSLVGKIQRIASKINFLRLIRCVLSSTLCNLLKR